VEICCAGLVELAPSLVIERAVQRLAQTFFSILRSPQPNKLGTAYIFPAYTPSLVEREIVFPPQLRRRQRFVREREEVDAGCARGGGCALVGMVL
jgi:hypothetical protein